MMATWTVEITVVDRAAGRIRAVGIRTDGTDIGRYVATGVVDPGDLSGSRQKVVDAVWAKYQKEVVGATQNAVLIQGWETALAGDLNTLEAG